RIAVPVWPTRHRLAGLCAPALILLLAWIAPTTSRAGDAQTAMDDETWADGFNNAGMSSFVNALVVYPTGQNAALIAGRRVVEAAGCSVQPVARWEGNRWAARGSGLGGGNVNALAVYNDGTGNKLVAAGDFSNTGLLNAFKVAIWDGTIWKSLTPMNVGMNGAVTALTVWNGMLIAAGSFTNADGVAANHVAAWNPATSRWIALGNGLGSPYETVTSLAVFHNDLYAGGTFRPGYIARWSPVAGSPSS